MDVRCEKCHTEYELEESRVTEAGVTVKCTSCGNLFKIKRKSATPPAIPQRAPEPAPVDFSGMWLLRQPGAETRRFKELTQLQQWIVERKVTREAEISRTGETWKKLGDIAELASFFAIVDQASQAAIPRQPEPPSVERKSTDPMASGNVAPAKPRPQDDFIAHADTLYDTDPVQLAPPVVTTVPAPAAPERPRAAPTAVVKKPAERPPRRDSWVGAAVEGEDAEPAWATSADDKKSQRTVKVEPSPFAPDDFGDYELGRRRRGGKGWIVALLALLGGGGAAAYFLYFKPQMAAAPVAADAGAAANPVAASSAPDGGASSAASQAAQKLQDGLAKLDTDTDEGYAEAAKILGAAHVADDAADARLRAAEALVDTTAAQALDDRAETDRTADPAQLRAEAERRLTRAAKMAREAAAKAPNDPDVAVALADVLRLEKKPTAEVEKALAPAGEKPEALYVRAMLRVRDGKAAEAQPLLEKAVADKAKEGSELLRARYRLAVLEADAKKTDDAKRDADAVLAAQPTHARAKELRARLETPAPAPAAPAATPPPVATAKPVTPEPREKPGGKSTAADDTGPVTSGQYDGLVGKGNKLAENGDCVGAMRSFERALDARPGGVEALTGLGYCYLDRKQYAQALSNFRAALGISGKYNEALIGMAEAYRYQHLDREAVSYYRKYLEAAPSGPKAAMARRHVEELGGSDETPAPRPAPTPPPVAPPPVSAPALDKLPDKPGSGSGSSSTSGPNSAPPVDKLPDKPGAPAEEKPAEPPPPPAAAPEKPAGEPSAPDSAH